MAIPLIQAGLALMGPATAAHAAERSMYSVQVRAVSPAEREDGLRTYRTLRDKGYLAYHYDARIDGQRWLRIAVGVFESVEAAEAAGRVLSAAQGLDYFVANAPVEVIGAAGGGSFVITPSALWTRNADADREVLYFDLAAPAEPFRPGKVEFVPSSDRRTLAFEYGDRIAIARIDSPRVLLSERIPQMSGGAARPTPRWSPSGRHLAVIDFRDFEVNSSLWLIEAELGTVHPLVYNWGPGSQQAVKDFVWHPEKDRVLFVEGQAFGTVSVGGTLKAVDMDGNVSAIETVPEQKERYWEAAGPLRAEGGRLHFRKAVFDSNAMNVTWSDLSIPLPDFSE